MNINVSKICQKTTNKILMERSLINLVKIQGELSYRCDYEKEIKFDFITNVFWCLKQKYTVEKSFDEEMFISSVVDFKIDSDERYLNSFNNKTSKSYYKSIKS